MRIVVALMAVKAAVPPATHGGEDPAADSEDTERFLDATAEGTL